jgi:hypothetical protein
LQDDSEWLFTNKKTDEAHPFTMHVNFEKFSDGLKMSRLSLLVVNTEFLTLLMEEIIFYKFQAF